MKSCSFHSKNGFSLFNVFTAVGEGITVLEKADFAKCFLFCQKCCKVSACRCLCCPGVGGVCVLGGETLQILKSYGCKTFLVQPCRTSPCLGSKASQCDYCCYGHVNFTGQSKPSPTWGCWVGLFCADRDDFLTLCRGGKQSLTAVFALQTPVWNFSEQKLYLRTASVGIGKAWNKIILPQQLLSKQL